MQNIIFLSNSFKIFKIVYGIDYLINLRKFVNNEIETEKSYIKYLGECFKDTEKRKTLHRLVLGISNLCNFKCEYCYAKHGNYGATDSYMSYAIAKSTVDKLYSLFTKIDMIQFFGGEPLLVFEEIEKLYNHIIALYNKGIIKDLPRIGITTNGSVLNHNILKFLKQNNISLTVSLDGNPEINDMLRKAKNGGITSCIVERNICKLKEAGIKIEIEATFTNYHIEKHIGVFDTLQYFRKKFGPVPVHIPPVSAPLYEAQRWQIIPKFMDQSIMSYWEAIDKCIKTWIESDYPLSFSFLDRYLFALLKKQKMPFLCPAYVDTLAIWYNGDIYPCFMFFGDERYKIGNIFTVPIDELQFYNNKFIYLKTKFNRCKHCWARWICYTCAGGVVFMQGQLDNLNKDICAFNKAIIERIIFNLSMIRTSESTYANLIKNLSKLRKIGEQ